MEDRGDRIDWDIPMYGREDELARLHEALADVRSGNGRTVLVSGEAGVGKTRLVEELMAEATDALVLRGPCLPESLEPLLPVREALRSADLEESFTGIVPPKLVSAYVFDRDGAVLAQAFRGEL